MNVLVIGSTASGKSEFAEKIACKLCKGQKLYIATMKPFDEECYKKIEKHRKMRSKKNFETIEQQVDLHLLDSNIKSTAMLECMSNLLANEMYREDKTNKEIDKYILKGIEHLSNNFENLIVVSNNVFQNQILYDPFTEKFIEFIGNINNIISRNFDVVVEIICGIPIYHKGGELLNEIY